MIGAFSKEVAKKMVRILVNLDTEFAYTFNSEDGLDEVSTTSGAVVFELKDKMVSQAIRFTAESIGFQRVEMNSLRGGLPKVNAEIFNSILDNKATQAQKEIVELNAAFGIQASGKAASLLEAKELAVESLASGKARKLFDQFVEATNSIGV